MRRPVLLAGAVGGLWGLAGYAVLWGHTPLIIHRSFVVSGAGTVLLFPIRLVLWGIRFVEEHVAAGPFDFSENNAWIGAAAAVVGATLVMTAFLLVREIGRRFVPRPATPGPGPPGLDSGLGVAPTEGDSRPTGPAARGRGARRRGGA